MLVCFHPFLVTCAWAAEKPVWMVETMGPGAAWDQPSSASSLPQTLQWRELCRMPGLGSEGDSPPSCRVQEMQRNVGPSGSQLHCEC